MYREIEVIIVMFKWFVMMLFIKDKWLLLVVVLIEKIDKFDRCFVKFVVLYYILNIRLYLFNIEIREVL